jgi:hypothetical protein
MTHHFAKKPRTRVSTLANKSVLSERHLPSSAHLVWRFGQLDHDGDFGWHNLTLDCVQELERQLENFQSTPIHVLEKDKRLKFVEIGDMTPVAQVRLRIVAVGIGLEGLTELRLGFKRWRIWGHFQDPQFSFLWWDPDHKVATGAARRRHARR